MCRHTEAEEWPLDKLDFLSIAHCSALDFPELLKISYIFTKLSPLNIKIDMGPGDSEDSD